MEAEAQSGYECFLGIARAFERLENALHAFSGYSNPVINGTDRTSRTIPIERDGDFAAVGRVLDRVINNVREYLRDAVWIRMHYVCIVRDINENTCRPWTRS